MPDQEKGSGYATVLHLSGLAGSLIFCFVPLLNIILPLAMWLAKRKEDNFVDFHGREAVRFQVFFTIYGFVFSFLAFVVLFGSTYYGVSTFEDAFVIMAKMAGVMFIVIAVIIVFCIIAVVFPIVAAIKAHDGRLYCYPFTFSPRRHNKKNCTCLPPQN